MQQTYQLCNIHQQPIKNMCIEKHACEDRRLCVQCLFNHEGSKSAPLVDDFHILLKEKLNEYQEDNLEPFLATIETIQSQMNQQFLQIKSQVNCLIDQIKEIGKQIVSLKQKVFKTPILEFSSGDYNLMVDIINKNIIENNNAERNQFQNSCQKQLLKLSDDCKKFNDQLNSLTVQMVKEELEGGIQIEGLQQLGLRHGDYYYVNQEGIKSFAGQYSFGLKTGWWNDYLGFDKILGKIIYKEIIYKFGVNQGLQQMFVGKFNQMQGKEGKWIEYEGKQCQIMCQGNYNDNVKVGEWLHTFDDQVCGNGVYNEYEQKHGKWIEPIDRFNKLCQVTFSGEYKNGIRVGQWITTYKKDVIGGGTYDDKGVMIGNWTELHENFQDDCQVTYSGKYKNGIKVGQWITTYKNDKIVGGTFDDCGVKIGNWTELHENFNEYCKVKYSGEYKNGIKVGYWITTSENDKIGGGNYDDRGVKIGNWTEIHENSDFDCQVKYSGEYQNGIKIGQWITTYENDEIGGGTYDDRGVKIGNWTEIHENFNYYCQVKYSGEYKNGIKIGQWITTYKTQKIGGGSFDDSGVKIGNWTELHEKFSDYRQAIYNGEYQNGIKVGQWITTYKKDQIGGGTYDNRGVQIGNWTEPYENFQDNCQVVCQGDKKNGIKVGEWIITFKNYKIGGGTYDDRGLKIGNWTELHENFYDYCQVTLNGDNKNGIKVGQWITTYKNQKLGGGSYDDGGFKIGNWTEIRENFNEDCQLIYSGEYKNGMKVGQWITTYKKDKIGGGTYDDRGVKIGNWTELHEKFYDGRQVIYSGEYKNGIPVGQWDTTYKKDKIGGGNYDDRGVKIGNWTELHENFHDSRQVTYIGEYKNGIKVGQWITTYKKDQIGGGSYDDMGVKIGNWTELHDNFSDFLKVTYSAEYNNGIKEIQ